MIIKFINTVAYTMLDFKNYKLN